MRIELIYGQDGCINGHRINYFENCNMKPIEENEYVIEDEDIKPLTEWLVEHPKATKVEKSAKLKMLVPLKPLKEKIKKNQEPTEEEYQALRILRKGINRNLTLEVKDNGETLIHNLN